MTTRHSSLSSFSCALHLGRVINEGCVPFGAFELSHCAEAWRAVALLQVSAPGFLPGAGGTEEPEEAPSGGAGVGRQSPRVPGRLWSLSAGAACWAGQRQPRSLEQESHLWRPRCSRHVGAGSQLPVWVKATHEVEVTPAGRPQLQAYCVRVPCSGCGYDSEARSESGLRKPVSLAISSLWRRAWKAILLRLGELEVVWDPVRRRSFSPLLSCRLSPDRGAHYSRQCCALILS